MRLPSGSLEFDSPERLLKKSVGRTELIPQLLLVRREWEACAWIQEVSLFPGEGFRVSSVVIFQRPAGHFPYNPKPPCTTKQI
jgi:hypothetical protein